MMRKWLDAAIGTLALFSTAAAHAQSVADFYRGKQIRFIVRTASGGDYDQYSRLFARFMGRFIPGNPNIIVINMPGGGGIVAANFMAKLAPHDGTVIGIVSQGLALEQALELSGELQADLRQFNWIANVVFSNQLLVVWHGSQTKTFEDAKRRETVIGTTGAGSASVQFPAFYNNVAGTKFKLVTGYISGQEIDLAMERGEVEGRGTNTYAGYMASKPDWIPRGRIIPLVQAGVEKEPSLPNVPLILDLDVKPENKSLLEFMARAAAVGRPLATTPNVPADRVAALRKAFFDTIADPEFIETAKRENMEIRPMTGEKLTELIVGIIGSPPEVKARLKAALDPKPEQMKDAETKPKEGKRN
jgi:tripartite-type tricarboxylate transporter receptor subunit TctC